MKHGMHRHTWHKAIAALAAIPLTVAGLGVAPLTASAAPSVPTDGLVADYSFASKPSDGKTVANTASGSSFGPAVVQRGSDDLWKDNALTLTGGKNDTTGDWVKLPSDLLKGQTKATIQIEVKADPVMLQTFHFLWNIGNNSNAEYLFTALNCANGRQPLVGLKTAATGENLVQSSGCPVSADTFMSLTAVVDGTNEKLYVNGTKIADGDAKSTPDKVADQSLDTIARSPWGDPLFSGAVSTFRVWHKALDATEVSNVSTVDAALHKDALVDSELSDITVPSRVTSSFISLPTKNGTVSWTSSDPSVIAANGVVSQPDKGEAAKQVRLTATVTVRGVTASKSYDVTVEPTTKTADERLSETAAGYAIPAVLRSGQSLPTLSGASVVLSASKDLTLKAVSGSSAQTVSVSGDKPVSGTITATITSPKATKPVVKKFAVTILPVSDSSMIAAYDRNATSVDEANNGDIAASMHLALSKDGSWQPYNENYGIFFARLYKELPKLQDTKDWSRSLKDPALFYTKDGTFGVVSVRTKRGTTTVSDPGSILVATSKDLLSYDEKENSGSVIKLGETNGVNSPRIVWDDAAGTYVVFWKDDNGVAKHATLSGLDSTATIGTVSLGGQSDVSALDSASGIANFRSGNQIPVSKDIVKGLDVRFGRITNTSRSIKSETTVTKGTALSKVSLPGTVSLSYSDGSKGSLPVKWDLSGVDTSKAGDYQVTGTIKQTEYQIPFAEDRADPSVYKWKWTHMVDGKKVTQTKFLFIATNDINGDCTWQAGSPHMPFRMADSIEALADTPNDAHGLIASSDETVDGKTYKKGYNPKEVSLLTAGDTDADGNKIMHSFWAPEIHEINGRLTILFMAGYGNVWTNGHAVYMQLKKDANGYDMDPSVPANWDKPVTILRPDGKALATTSTGTVGMSLDMTYFKDGDGQSYYAWQQLGATYIAKVDPSNPARVTTMPVRIVTPEYAWNVTIAEGPNIKLRDGKLYLIFSGSSVGKTYTTGLAVAKASGTDLTDPASWKVLNYPIQKSGPFNGKMQLGTGHGMWSEDEDGNDIYVFHAYANKTAGFRNTSGRDTFVRRVHWASDGYPVFDMSQSEELAGSTKVTGVVHVVDSESAGLVLKDKSGAKVTGSTIRLVKGADPYLVKVDVSPDSPVTWSSSDPSVASVEATSAPASPVRARLFMSLARVDSATYWARVTPHKAGTATITATTADGRHVSMQVSVSDPSTPDQPDQPGKGGQTGDHGATTPGTPASGSHAKGTGSSASASTKGVKGGLVNTGSAVMGIVAAAVVLLAAAGTVLITRRHHAEHRG